MGLLSKATAAEILAGQPVREEIVPVAEWGCEVRVRGLSAYDREIFEEIFGDEEKESSRGTVRAKLVAMTCIDEAGTLLFGEADLPKLQAQPASAIDALFQAARRLSGMDKDAQEKAEKNSVPGRNGSLPCASR
jgi:hypothetical protein